MTQSAWPVAQADENHPVRAPEYGATAKGPKRVVLALGAYTLSRGQYPVMRGKQAVEDAACASFPGEEIEVVSIGAFGDFLTLLKPTVEDAKRLNLMKF